MTARTRGGERLNELPAEPPADPSLEELGALARGRGPIWLAGGEPTLRADLPELVRALRPRGLVSDALPFAREGALDPLLDAGLERVRVILHAARADAHDFLVGRAGAAKLAVRAIGRLSARAVRVEIVATITRSTLPLLPELVEAAATLGVREVLLRRPVARGAVAADFILLSPRLAQLSAYLELAASAALVRDVRLAVRGFPACAVPRELYEPTTPEALVPEGSPWDAVRAALAEPAHERGCPRCPGAPLCAGAPADYVARFGRDEIRSEQGVASAPVPLPSGGPPPPRAGRAPATRRSRVLSLVGKRLSGDPLAFVPALASPEVLRFRFGAPSRVMCPDCGEPDAPLEPTRSVRLRLVRAAQQGARVLRVASAGSLAHPDAAALLRETTLLSFERVEIAGEASRLDELSDADLYALTGIARLDLALYGPDAESHDAHVGRPGAFAAALRAAHRLADLAGTSIGSFAVLHDATQVSRYADAWQSGALPGTPAVRLSARGAALGSLAGAARALAAGPMLEALTRVLPPCISAREAGFSPARHTSVAFEEELELERPPAGSDPYGKFRACACGAELASRCPGIAEGWQKSTEP